MSFAPVYSENSRALILGTWPSPKSREMAFYYGHPQNRFWPMMAALTGEPVPAREDIEAKKRHHPPPRPRPVGHAGKLHHHRGVGRLYPGRGAERHCISFGKSAH